MEQEGDQPVLPRTSNNSSSTCKSNNTNKIIPYTSPSPSDHHRALVRRPTAFQSAAAYLRSLFSPTTLMPTCTSLPTPRKVTGTLFGHRRGQVTFVVQTDPRSEPVFLIELAVSTSTLVKEMSSGIVRIALESEKPADAWTMYCNGRKCGCANSRECTDSDWRVLSTVKTVSVGAGVIPMLGGELLYMRARFERVVGSRDSEAYYMLNPDGNGGPELSLFLLSKGLKIISS